MLIVAIDTALDACAAGVLDTAAGRLMMPLIARVIRQSGIGFAALDRIAVTTGPGSFTGLRVEPQPAPDIAWAGRLGAAVTPETVPARPYYLRAPDAKTQEDMLQKAAQPSVP